MSLTETALIVVWEDAVSMEEFIVYVVGRDEVVEDWRERSIESISCLSWDADAVWGREVGGGVSILGELSVWVFLGDIVEETMPIEGFRAIGIARDGEEDVNPAMRILVNEVSEVLFIQLFI